MGTTKKAIPADDKTLEKEIVKKEIKTAKKTVKATAKKEEKAVPAKKASVKKTASKITSSIYVQYAGKELLAENLLEEAKAEFAASGSNEDLKTIELYVKPEENTAYYVINGDFYGTILL